MNKYFLDAGTTYSKMIAVEDSVIESISSFLVDSKQGQNYYIIPSKKLKQLDLKFNKACGHMASNVSQSENEIIALASGALKRVSEDSTILDLGSRDAKWIRFKNSKFSDMDWNTSCASSTGATVEMLMKFYDIELSDLKYNEQKFPVTCGIFGLEKIMDDISKGALAQDSISKFIHGIAYNAWSFAKKPDKLYLSGGFCQNECFVESLKSYCEVVTLGRFVLCEGLVEDV